jgi:release factor glutamine methyltransferase
MLTDPESDYARGTVPFLGCTIHLDSRPLIPRFETEFWTEKAIEKIKSATRSVTVLDLCAGSGAIGVAVLKHTSNTRVDFGEIDPSHLPTIAKNISANGIDPERARIFQTDMWSVLNDRYDFILTNPPYIDEKNIDRVQDSVIAFEPHTALFATDNGFALIEIILTGLPEHLSSAGVAFIEHEPEQAERINTTAKKLGLTVTHQKDQYGVFRYSEVSSVA